MKSYLITFISVTLLLFTACQKSEFLAEGDFFHVSHKGAKMPVWVMGNFDSDVMLITVHGGPGDTGMGFHLSRGFQALENDYMIVYWDQRYSGMTQGNYDRETLNPDQFIEDTDQIVKVLQAKYPDKKFFMLGHSWGGQLSAAYLGRDNHHTAFRGWIDLNGSLYGELEAQMMKDWILARVPAKLAQPDADTAYWQFIIDWYEENPNPGNYSRIQPYLYVSALEGDAVNWEETQAENPIPYGTLIFKSMFSLSYYVYSFGEREDMEQWDALNYTPELENITIPALMLWGADDGIVPADLADYVHEHLATPEGMKKVVKIPDCAHGPQNDTPEAFYQEIKTFIETYK